jgi:hypothetical protein
MMTFGKIQNQICKSNIFSRVQNNGGEKRGEGRKRKLED